jgi:hypothetical protein
MSYHGTNMRALEHILGFENIQHDGFAWEVNSSQRKAAEPFWVTTAKFWVPEWGVWGARLFKSSKLRYPQILEGRRI